MTETEKRKLEKACVDSKSCVGIIMVDNYEETMQRIPDEEKPQIIAQIEKAIYDWAELTNGIIVKTDRDRFLYIFEHFFTIYNAFYNKLCYYITEVLIQRKKD